MILVAVAGLLVVYHSPLHGLLMPSGGESLRNWLASFGPWAPVAFVGLCSASVGLGAPRLVFATAAGLLFGVWLGILLAQAGTMLGCHFAFAWARRLRAARPLARIGGAERLSARFLRHPVATQVALRLFPLSNGLALNVLLGLSAIRLRDFAAGAFLGTLPGTILCVLFGGSASSASAAVLLAAGGSLTVLTVVSWRLAWRSRAEPDTRSTAS